MRYFVAKLKLSKNVQQNNFKLDVKDIRGRVKNFFLNAFSKESVVAFDFDRLYLKNVLNFLNLKNIL